MIKLLYDITVPIHSDMPVYEGDDPIITTPLFTVEKDGANVTGIQNFTTHFGTHVDPPLHFVTNGKSLDEIPLDQFWGKARVIYIKNQDAITPDELEHHQIEAGDIVLFRTRNTEAGLLGIKEFQQDHVYVTAEAALSLVKKGVKLVGIDYLSVDKAGDSSFPAHNTFLQNGVIILESVRLSDVPSGIYYLLCLPLRIKHADGAPARAVLAEY